MTAPRSRKGSTMSETKNTASTGVRRTIHGSIRSVLYCDPACPPKLLLVELPHRDRGVGEHERRRLVHGAVALLEREVRQRAIVGDLEEDTEKPAVHELVHRLHDDLATKGDRAAREAADVPEHRLGGHGVLDAAVLQPVGPPGQEVPMRVEDPLTRGHSADPWVGERLDELAQRVAGPHG